ncbi:hypothetical protein LPJ73_003781, partial [Coemansia sp. RSA 2703]
MHSSDSGESESAGPKTLAERIALLGLEREAGRAGSRASVHGERPAVAAKPAGLGIGAGARHAVVENIDNEAEAESSESEFSAGSSSVQSRISRLGMAVNPFASPELEQTGFAAPVSPIAAMPATAATLTMGRSAAAAAAAVPVLGRRATDASVRVAQSVPPPALTPTGSQHRLSRMAPPRPPPKPLGISGARSPTTGSMQVGSGLRTGSVPLPPPPPPPMQALAQTQVSATVAAPTQGGQRCPAQPPPPPPHPPTLPPPPPPPVPPPPPPAIATGVTAASRAHTLGKAAWTDGDGDDDAATRPMVLRFGSSNRRPPTSGAPSFLSVEGPAGAAGGAAVVSCISGGVAVVVSQGRLVCTRIDTGDVCALHNAPGADERFTCVAPVQTGDASGECARVWASTTAGRVVVANTGGGGAYAEALAVGGTAAGITCLLSSGVGEVWTLRGDGACEVWRDRSVGGGSEGAALQPVRRFTLAAALAAMRRAPTARTAAVVGGRTLWVAGTRGVWAFDTQRTGGGGAAHVDAQMALARGDAALTCLATNAAYGGALVFGGTEDGHVIAWSATTRRRVCTADVGGGERVRVAALACASQRWLWVGLGSGRLAVVDVGGGGGGARWTALKTWAPGESPVAALHVDWTGARVLVASVHAGGTAHYWDGALAHDVQAAALRRRAAEYAVAGDVAVHVHTWNAGAAKPEALGGALTRWLTADGTLAAPHVLAVGLQEVVDLESKTQTARSLWHTTTGGRDASPRYQRWRTALESALRPGAAFAAGFRVVETQSLVGLFVCVLARDDVVRRVRSVGVAHVKTGMGGLHGNKGAVAVRLVLDDSALCFVNAHLAAGESPSNNAARRAHVAAIVRGLTFARPPAEPLPSLRALSADLANVALDAMAGGGDGSRFLDHALCFFAGDLNFRLRT